MTDAERDAEQAAQFVSNELSGASVVLPKLVEYVRRTRDNARGPRASQVFNGEEAVNNESPESSPRKGHYRRSEVPPVARQLFLVDEAATTDYIYRNWPNISYATCATAPFRKYGVFTSKPTIDDHLWYASRLVASMSDPESTSFPKFVAIVEQVVRTMLLVHDNTVVCNFLTNEFAPFNGTRDAQTYREKAINACRRAFYGVVTKTMRYQGILDIIKRVNTRLSLEGEQPNNSSKARRQKDARIPRVSLLDIGRLHYWLLSKTWEESTMIFSPISNLKGSSEQMPILMASLLKTVTNELNSSGFLEFASTIRMRRQKVEEKMKKFVSFLREIDAPMRLLVLRKVLSVDREKRSKSEATTPSISPARERDDNPRHKQSRHKGRKERERHEEEEDNTPDSCADVVEWEVLNELLGKFLDENVDLDGEDAFNILWCNMQTRLKSVEGEFDFQNILLIFSVLDDVKQAWVVTSSLTAWTPCKDDGRSLSTASVEPSDAESAYGDESAMDCENENLEMIRTYRRRLFGYVKRLRYALDFHRLGCVELRDRWEKLLEGRMLSLVAIRLLCKCYGVTEAQYRAKQEDVIRGKVCSIIGGDNEVSTLTEGLNKIIRAMVVPQLLATHGEAFANFRVPYTPEEWALKCISMTLTDEERHRVVRDRRYPEFVTHLQEEEEKRARLGHINTSPQISKIADKLWQPFHEFAFFAARLMDLPFYGLMRNVQYSFVSSSITSKGDGMKKQRTALSQASNPKPYGLAGELDGLFVDLLAHKIISVVEIKFNCADLGRAWKQRDKLWQFIELMRTLPNPSTAGDSSGSERPSPASLNSGESNKNSSADGKNETPGNKGSSSTSSVGSNASGNRKNSPKSSNNTNNNTTTATATAPATASGVANSINSTVSILKHSAYLGDSQTNCSNNNNNNNNISSNNNNATSTKDSSRREPSASGTAHSVNVSFAKGASTKADTDATVASDGGSGERNESDEETVEIVVEAQLYAVPNAELWDSKKSLKENGHVGYAGVLFPALTVDDFDTMQFASQEKFVHHFFFATHPPKGAPEYVPKSVEEAVDFGYITPKLRPSVPDEPPLPDFSLDFSECEEGSSTPPSSFSTDDPLLTESPEHLLVPLNRTRKGGVRPSVAFDGLPPMLPFTVDPSVVPALGSIAHVQVNGLAYVYATSLFALAELHHGLSCDDSVASPVTDVKRKRAMILNRLTKRLNQLAKEEKGGKGSADNSNANSFPGSGVNSYKANGPQGSAHWLNRGSGRKGADAPSTKYFKTLLSLLNSIAERTLPFQIVEKEVEAEMLLSERDTASVSPSRTVLRPRPAQNKSQRRRYDHVDFQNSENRGTPPLAPTSGSMSVRSPSPITLFPVIATDTGHTEFYPWSCRPHWDNPATFTKLELDDTATMKEVVLAMQKAREKDLDQHRVEEDLEMNDDFDDTQSEFGETSSVRSFMKEVAAKRPDVEALPKVTLTWVDLLPSHMRMQKIVESKSAPPLFSEMLEHLLEEHTVHTLIWL